MIFSYGLRYIPMNVSISQWLVTKFCVCSFLSFSMPHPEGAIVYDEDKKRELRYALPRGVSILSYSQFEI